MTRRSSQTPRRPRGIVRRRLAANAPPPVVVAPKSLRIPITNAHGGGDYTATLLVGSRQQPVNLIVDTGSSALVVAPKSYDLTGDTQQHPTSLAQVVLYGTGGWAGPVIQTGVTVGGVGLRSAPLALAEIQEPDTFGAADGILGLAYNVLNDAYDLRSYLTEKQVA